MRATVYVDGRVQSRVSHKLLVSNNILALKFFLHSTARVMNQFIGPWDIWKSKQGINGLLQN